MNTRSCLLTVGASALLLTGSIIGAAPASAAPGSPECVAAETALKTELGIATVDINLANRLRTVITSLETIGAQLEPLYAAAELSLEDEATTLDTAIEAELEAERLLAEAKGLLAQAEAALAAITPADPTNQAYADAQAAVAAAQEAVTTAQTTYDNAVAASTEADDAYIKEAEALFTSPEILALEAQADAAIVSLDEIVVALGLTEGADPERLLALADAAIAACSAPAVVAAPVATTPAPQQQQRGLNIQTAANDVDATAPANLGLLAGLAGLGAAAGATALVVRRRQAQ